MVESIKSRFSPYGVAYFIMFGVIVASIVYSTVHTNTSVGSSERRQIDRSARQLTCLSDTFEDFLSGN